MIEVSKATRFDGGCNSCGNEVDVIKIRVGDKMGQIIRLCGLCVAELESMLKQTAGKH